MRIERRQRLVRGPFGFFRRDVTKVPFGIVLALVLAILVAIALAC
jgi:hypothetical protein